VVFLAGTLHILKLKSYAGMMLNAIANLSCSKWCWHNWHKPSRKAIISWVDARLGNLRHEWFEPGTWFFKFIFNTIWVSVFSSSYIHTVCNKDYEQSYMSTLIVMQLSPINILPHYPLALLKVWHKNFCLTWDIWQQGRPHNGEFQCGQKDCIKFSVSNPHCGLGLIWGCMGIWHA